MSQIHIGPACFADYYASIFARPRLSAEPAFATELEPMPRWTPAEDESLLAWLNPLWPHGPHSASLAWPASDVAAALTLKHRRQFTKSAVSSRLRKLHPIQGVKP